MPLCRSEATAYARLKWPNLEVHFSARRTEQFGYISLIFPVSARDAKYRRPNHRVTFSMGQILDHSASKPLA